MKWVAGLVVLGMLAIAAVAVLASSGGATPDRGAVEVVMTEMRFAPNRLDARVGQPLVVTIVNRGAQRHDLAFPSRQMPGLAGIETVTEPGETKTLTLRFDAPGEFQFICTIPGHAAAGMTGAVFVTP